MFREVALMGQGRPDYLRDLLKQEDVKINALMPTTKSTALYDACKHGHEGCVAVLLEHEADPNVRCGRDVSRLRLESARA